jgi:hypothetical protein
VLASAGAYRLTLPHEIGQDIFGRLYPTNAWANDQSPWTPTGWRCATVCKDALHDLSVLVDDRDVELATLDAVDLIPVSHGPDCALLRLEVHELGQRLQPRGRETQGSG